MRLKTDIFLRISLATVLPLTALVFGATVYSERLYQEDVDRSVTTSLNRIVAEVDRHFALQREIIRSLAGVQVIQDYLPVLEEAARGDIHPQLFERSERISHFFQTIQDVLPGISSLRVLDISANTMAKVQFGRAAMAAFDGIESFPYAEEERDLESLAQRLRALPAGEVSFLLLTAEEDAAPMQPLLDAVVPLMMAGQPVGYLVAGLGGEQVDRILDVVQRPQGGALLVAEINPDWAHRDGLVLYDDERIGLGDGDSRPRPLLRERAADLWAAVQGFPFGSVDQEERSRRSYYLEYLPYPNQLVSWVVAVQVDLEALSAPFNRIRYGILLFAVLALALSLLLVRWSARRVAAPISELSRGLKAYADGGATVRFPARGTDELRQLVDSYNYMLETLRKAEQERDKARDLMVQSAKLASIGQLAAGIGHELNNPLNNILTLTKLMERGLPECDGHLAEDLASLREEALRASRIVGGVLNFARQVPPEVSTFDLRQWLDETLPLVKQAAKRRRVNLVVTCDDGQVLGDRSQLQQVLINLLLNAIQASPEGGEARVSARRAAKVWSIQVRDHGAGIADEARDKIFDPFFTTKPVGDGTGLGLSISLGIVERHGGRLRVENAPGGGAIATAELPLVPVEGLADGRTHDT